MRKLRMGMVGGCPGKFICDAHHMAWRLDGLIELVAGSFSPNSERNNNAAQQLGIAPDRVYATYQEMFEAEAQRPVDQRMQLVASITPNHIHAPVAIAALRAGFAVISDKPLAFSLAEAKALKAAVDQSGLLFALTHNYSGYPMVKQAKELIASGTLGTVLKVVAEYAQGSVAHVMASGDAERIAAACNPGHQTDVSGCFSDIGVHAAQLSEYICGIEIKSALSDASTIVPNRSLDDDANVLLRFNNGAKGVLIASQICSGHENPLAIKVHTEKGSLAWAQENPNNLELRLADKPMQILRSGRYFDLPGQSPKHATRLPAGHPEGYIEAFACIYRNVARVLLAEAHGEAVNPLDQDFPSVDDGLRGMALIQAVYDSSKNNSAWVDLEK